MKENGFVIKGKTRKLCGGREDFVTSVLQERVEWKQFIMTQPTLVRKREEWQCFMKTLDDESRVKTMKCITMLYIEQERRVTQPTLVTHTTC